MYFMAHLKVAKPVCCCFSTLTNVPSSSEAEVPLCTTESSSQWF